MKRLLILTITMLFCLAMPFAMALASEAVPPDTGGPAITLPDTFFSWEYIGTIPGAIAAVVLLVQVLKLPLDKVWKIPTQAVVFFLSIGILLLAQTFVPSLGGLTVQTALLCFINGSIVALAAMSTYELTIKRVEEKQYYQQYEPAELLEMNTRMTEDDIQKVAAAAAAAIKAQTTSTGT